MNTVPLIKMTTAVAVAALVYASPVWADDDEREEKIALADCPAAVQKTINNNLGGGTVVEVEKETGRDQIVTFEAEVRKANGKMVDITVDAKGTLLGVEEEEDDDEDGDDEDK